MGIVPATTPSRAQTSSGRAARSPRAAFRVLLLVSALFAPLPGVAQTAGAEAQTPGDAARTASAFTTENALNVKNVSMQSLTRDGRFIAATIATHRDRLNVDHLRFGDPTYIAPSLAEVVVFDAETGEQTALFDGRVQARAFNWSPDGRTLAFFLRDGDEYRLHLYDRSRDRLSTVAVQGGKAIAANSPLLWRPDGNGIVLTLRDEEWAGRSRGAWEALTEAPVIVQDSRDPFLAWDAVRDLDNLVVPAIVTVPSGAVRELLPEGRVGNLRQSRDGSFLTYIETTPIRTAYARTGGSEFEHFRLNVENGETRSFIARTEDRTNPTWNGSGDAFAYAERGDVFVHSVFEDAPVKLTTDHRGPVSETDTTSLRYSVERWSPDGERLLVESQRGYHLLHAATGAMELVLEKPDDPSGEAARLSVVSWSPDGHRIYLTHAARDRWERGLVRYDLRTRTATDLVRTGDTYSGWRFSGNGQRIVYTSSNGDLPNELYVADADLSAPVRLTDLNPWLRDRTLTRSELVSYLDVDGNTLYGILYYPVNYREGERYPLVAEIYESFFDNGFNVNMNLIANAGWFGFRPSARLETGYPGEGWLKGVTAGINTLIERGLVDGDRLGIHGTSYGGYATNLLITQTNRFAAAINISGKVNMVSFLGDSPKITTRNYRAAENGQDRIGATLWEQPHKYIAHSAVMFADRIETPLLMLTGEGDWNVPATNQREMYYALRRLDKEVVWVHYMNAGHGAGRSGTVPDFHDHWSRIIDWYGEHFRTPEERRADS